MDAEGTTGVAVGFFQSFEFLQCFNDLDLFILFRTICSINAQVEMSILSCLAHRIRLLVFTKLNNFPDSPFILWHVLWTKVLVKIRIIRHKRVKRSRSTNDQGQIHVIKVKNKILIFPSVTIVS